MTRHNPHWQLSVALLSLAVLPTGCASDTGGSPGNGAMERPLYALLSIAIDPDDNATSYVVLTDTPDMSSVSLETAREFPGRVNIAAHDGELFVASAEDLSVARYAIGDAHDWHEHGRMSFQNRGLEGWQVQLGNLVGDGAAYMPVDVSARLVWSPAGLEIVSTKTGSAVHVEKDGLLAYGNGWGFELKEGPPLFVFSYQNEADYGDRGVDVEVAVYDPDTHEEKDVFTVPCPGIGYSSQDEAGNSYLANWDYWPTRALYGLAPASCVRRVKPDGALDESWTPDLTAWTGGRHIMYWEYLRDGKAIGNVLHHERLNADFRGPLDPDVEEEIQNGEHYRPWLFDLETETAKPIEGLDEILWALPLATVDSRTFAMLPYDDWRRTEVYEISLDGTATHRFSTTGYVESWERVR